MRVTLVDNVFLEQTGNGVTGRLQPPLGLIALIAALRAGGHDARLVDPKLLLYRGDARLDAGFYAAVAQHIAEQAPEIVGFTTLGCNFVCTLKIARYVRAALPGVPIVLGGPHASILDAEILERYGQFDAIARGEADLTVVALVDALGGKGDLGDVPGVSYRSSGGIARTADGGPVLDLDALPLPAYDAYPIAELGLTGLDIDAGRGCPFSCTFCSTASFFGRRYRIKSAGRLVHEMTTLEQRYGVRAFGLAHDLFTVNKTKVTEFCRAVAPHNYRWSCSARMDCVDAELLERMHDAGCTQIYYGVETGSERMQQVTQKRLDLDLFHPTLTRTTALGMSAVTSFIIGYPEERVEDQNATLDLIGETLAYGDAATIQLHLLTPEPGTALHARYAGSLAFDGYVTDFNFPVLEDDDAAIIADDPAVFVCHHYYAEGSGRAKTIGTLEAYQSIWNLGRDVVAALAGQKSLSSILRALTSLQDGFEHERIVRALEGALARDASPASRAREAVARAQLTVEHAQPLSAIGDDSLFRLARNVAPIAGGPARPRLLIASRDLRAGDVFDIDDVTFELVRALRQPTAYSNLQARFFDVDIRSRVNTLCLLGTLVGADRHSIGM